MLATVNAQAIDCGKGPRDGAPGQDGEGISDARDEVVNQRHIESSIQTRSVGHGQLAVLLADCQAANLDIEAAARIPRVGARGKLSRPCRRIASRKRTTGNHGTCDRTLAENVSRLDGRSRGSGQRAIHGRVSRRLGVSAGDLEIGSRSDSQPAGVAEIRGGSQYLAGVQRQGAFLGDGNEVSQSVVRGLVDDRRRCPCERDVRCDVHDVGPVELQRARDRVGSARQGCAREVTGYLS